MEPNENDALIVLRGMLAGLIAECTDAGLLDLLCKILLQAEGG